MPSPQRRPRLHLTARTGWINDPLGLTHHGGRYHLFFQYVPEQTAWAASCHWGHATSDDLLHWVEEPVALAPGDGDDGVWSGSVVVPDGEPPVLFYTAVSDADVQIGRVRVAHPRDGSLTSWDKGPVLVQAPPGDELAVFRDPFVFHDGASWRMLVGGGRPDGTAVALTYRSDDLRSWEYAGELASRSTQDREPVWTGAAWECPQLFELDGRHVLVVSVWEPDALHHVAYAVGGYADGRFTADRWGRLTYGPSYYAGSTFTDAQGGRGLVHWLRGVDDLDAGWAGATSLPHRLTLAGDVLVASPPAAVEALRRGVAGVARPDASVTVPSPCDLVWEHVDTGDDALAVHTRGGLELLALARTTGRLELRTPAGSWEMPDTGDDLRLVVDGPVAEVFTPSGVLAAPLAGVESEVEVRVAAGRVRVHALGER